MAMVLGEVSLKRWLWPRVAGVALLVAMIAPALASAADDTPLVSLSVGYYDQMIVDPGFLFLRVSPYKSEHKEAVDFRVEYRFGTSLLSGIESWA